MDKRDIDIVLASASPRRRQLLEEAGVDFRIHAVDVDETLEPDLEAEPLEAVKKLAERKAKAAVEELVTSDYDGLLVVIGSDTMVVLRGEIFGKPQDAEDARRMLQALSGCGHDVNTAVSVWVVHAPKDQDISLFYRTFVDTTYVYFKELDDAQIEDYIASGDPFDKAGAYGIQSGAAPFIDHIEGSLDTVIGLPATRLIKEFPDLFAC
ncbi:MAG: septum formation protein Maf [Eggerthellaceae bacterium]|jgi:septum formation protein|nr:septum formation protein Maf [Eggerthellaceae bacterium]